MRSHNLLTAAIDAHRRGDYELAAKFLDQAQAGQSELSDAERQDLASYQKRNAAALQARKDGTAQLREVEKKVAAGKTQEATDLLKKVATSRDYLAAEDKTKFNQLSDRLMPRTTAPSTSATAKAENTGTLARTKLRQARELLARGNFDAADQLAREADGLSVTYTVNEDTPRKVREDVTRGRSDPKFLMGAARAAYQRNELDRADQLAQAAEAASSSFTFPFWGDTPSKLRKEIAVAKSKTPAKTDTAKATTGSTSQPPAKTTETAATPQARSKTVNVEAATRLLTEARKSLDAGDVAKAEQLTNQARAANPDPRWWEVETTEKLVADIQKAKTAKSGTAAKQPTEDPRALVKRGRELMDAGKLEEATQVTLKAKAAGNSVHWGIFEDTPDSLLSDIDKAKVQHNKDESVKVLADGRKLYEKNDLDGARKAAYRALQLHGPYSILEMGDRPQKLLADIETAESKKRLVKVPPVPPAKGDTAVAQATPTTKPAAQQPASPFAGAATNKDQANTPIRPVSATDTPKQRVQTLLAEARQMQAAGRLVEARQRLQEAQRAGATFGPGEETPENALVQLNTTAYRRMVTLMEQADDYTKSGAADPGRCQKAEENLKEARQLALGFGFDVIPVDVRLAAVQKLRGGTAVASAPVPVPVGTASTTAAAMTAGRQRLNEAREELRRGQTNHARQLCAEAWKDEALRVEAGQLLRSIDQEELNQHCLEAAHAFDAGLVKYKEKDYQTASKVFALVDVKLLDRDRQAKLGEVMSSPEMQHSVVQVKGPALPGSVGSATATDTSAVAARPTVSGDHDFLKEAQAMQEVKFQKLREGGRMAQREAMDRFQAGDRDRAIEILQEYSATLDQASLAPDQLALLRHPIDDRIQKLRTLKAQQEFDDERRHTVDTKQFNPGEKALAVQHKQKQVAELMAQYETFYRDGKYLDAERQAQLALDLDPDNAAAAAALKIVRIQRNVSMNKTDKDQNSSRFVQGLRANEGPVVTDVEDPLYVDSDRAKANMTARRDMGRGFTTSSTTVAQREIEAKLNTPVPLKFTDTPLKKVLDDLKTWQGIPIFLDERSLQDEGINPNQPLSFEQEGLSLKSELNLILSQLHLTYMIKDEALVVTTEKNAKGRNVRKVYQVADLVIPVQNSQLPQAGMTQPLPVTGNPGGTAGNTQPYIGPFGLASGQQVGAAGTGSSGGNGPTVTKQGPSNTIEGELISLIKASIKPESWNDLGGTGTIEYFPIGQALIVDQTADIQEQVADLLQALRRLQDVEVAVEIRFISLDENFFERIGVNFNVNIPTNGNNARVQPQITSGNFTPDGQVNAPNFKNVLVGLQPGGPGNAGIVTNDLAIPITTGSYNFGAPPGYGNFVGAFPSGGLDIGLAFLSNIEVFLFMEAVQQDTRSNIMQAPKLVMFNGQSATLTVSDTQLFTTNVSVLPINGQIVAIPSTTPFNNGTFMSIQPIVSADRRFVRLGITQTMSNLATATVPLFPVVVPMFPDFNGGGTGEPVLVTQFIQQPITSTITVTTTVVVPDGGTVLIGGLKRLSEGRNESGPPVLSKIPYLNRLFKNEGYARETESLLMLVTPRIIITEEEESRATGIVPAPVATP